MHREAGALSIAHLIVLPALVGVGVTLLRLMGELQHWPKPIVNNDVCGKAVLGVVWLVPIFGTYIAVKLFRAGRQPRGFGRAIALAISALLLKLGGTFVAELPGRGYAFRVSMNLIITLGAISLSALARRFSPKSCSFTDMQTGYQ